MNWLAILPPSETKRVGGEQVPLNLDALSFPNLNEQRRGLIDRLTNMTIDDQMQVLRLTVKQRDWALDNAALQTAPTLRALERYTGVVYAALGINEFDDALWRAAGEHVAIGSALWGLTLAQDRIPRCRVSAGHRLIQGGWKQWWRGPLDEALHSVDGPILDLRSHAYAAMGGRHPALVAVEVVDAAGGKPLNHWNKHAKGMLTRNLLLQAVSGARFDPVAAAAMGGQQWMQVDDNHALLAVESPVKNRSAAPSLSR